MTVWIGVTVDNRDNTEASGVTTSPAGYSRALGAAGAVPVLLPQEPGAIAQYVERLDGLVLTGGNDPAMESYGQPTHARAKVMAERRQSFDAALWRAWRTQETVKPALGVCWGMQLMALEAGGAMTQHMPDVMGEEAAFLHKDRRTHGVVAEPGLQTPTVLPAGAPGEVVVSNHHQAMAETSPGLCGAMRVVARAPDGVIEAIDDAALPWCLAVQWHPERGGEGGLSRGVFRALVAACEREKAGV
ncbi:MAG: gamma-glutamyl-gamma-aminobutyrate hydrolase family protein [Planctomycetota bacterium]